MKATRGKSNVVFGLLPKQTVDLERSPWRVVRWAHPEVVTVDTATVRKELVRAIYPWTATGNDGGLAGDLLAGADLRVIAPNPESGVLVERFPTNFRCFSCGRIEGSMDQKCKCGARDWRQMIFVAYHDCGWSDTPWIPRCPEHKQVRVNLATSASTNDLRFECPVCRKLISTGFPWVNCKGCGNGAVSYNVHRASAVYTPRNTTVINPPTQEIASAYRSPGLGEQAIEWSLGGLEAETPRSSGKTRDSFIAELVADGMELAIAGAVADAAVEKGAVSAGAESQLSKLIRADRREEVLDAAVRLAHAAEGGRVRTSDLVEGASQPARTRYEGSYPSAIRQAGLDGIDLLPSFPVLDACFGFSRGSTDFGKTRLNAFRSGNGSLEVHGQLSNTEGLLFRLDPVQVCRWLYGRGLIKSLPPSASEARALIANESVLPHPGEQAEETIGAEVMRLVHSYSHRVMRRLSSFCGIDRDSLSEYLEPLHLSFIIYAAARGGFVMGGLQALFENDLDLAISDVLGGEHRCALDPECAKHGAACIACLHVGEPSCRYFNQFLDRRTLFGSGAYFAAD